MEPSDILDVLNDILSGGSTDAEYHENVFSVDEYGSPTRIHTDSDLHNPSELFFEFSGEHPSLEIFGEPVRMLREEGGEGKGDLIYIVIQVGDMYFRIDGFYSSWEGFFWDNPWYQAHPVEVSVTEYHRI